MGTTHVKILTLGLTVLVIGYCAQPVQAAQLMQTSSTVQGANKPLLTKRLNSQDPNRPLPPGKHNLRSDQAIRQDTSFTALDESEAAWLKRQGFPTRSELSQLFSMPKEELLRAIRDRNSPNEKIALGLKALRTGDLKIASMYLNMAALDGSLYAIEMLAYTEMRKFQQRQPRTINNEIQAQHIFLSYMQVARDLGDHRVVPIMRRLKRLDNSESFQRQVDNQANILQRNFAAESKKYRHTKTIRIIERPNRTRWEALDRNPNTPVIVIVR